MDLNGKAAVVTGGASGLGAATARELAAAGAKVAIFDIQDDKGESVAAEIGGAATLKATLHDIFLALPDETKVYSGHGPMTTIGQERRTNPFLTGAPW